VGEKYKGLKTPALVEYAQKFYNCTTANHIPLENDGGDGSQWSHFERAFFFNENMTASSFNNLKFSGFSFKLLEDSGWYGIDEKYFEDFHAG